MKEKFLQHPVKKNEIGDEFYFDELWNGSGDADELLESRTISTDNENILEFMVIEQNEDAAKTLVEITDIR
jgi:hypothetical protein